MEHNKIRIAITQGDVNGIGYEVILKTFADPTMLEFCTPIVYGSPKVMTYHRKALDLPTTFTIVESADNAIEGRLNVVNCNDDEVKVDLGQPTADAGKAAFQALEKAMEEYDKGLWDVLVTAPIDKQTIQSEEFPFVGHTDYLESKMPEGEKALMIMVKDSLRVALATTHLPLSKVASALTTDGIAERLKAFSKALKDDFSIHAPRIAVLALNPHAGDAGLLGKEENDIITPAIEAARRNGVICYGPFSPDGFWGVGSFSHFDGVLAMYHDQGLIPFKLMAMEEGVNYTAGLSLIRTSPDHGTAYNIAGKNEASEASFRAAIYTAIDVFRHRHHEESIRRNPLRKQFFDKRDDSDKLKFDLPLE